MKTVFFILLAVCYCHCLPSVISPDVDSKAPLLRGSFFDEKVRAKLEQLKDDMKKGISFLNNTVLDPLDLQQANYSVDVAEVSGKLSVKQFHLENLSTYDVKTAAFNLSKPWDVKVELAWPGEINLNTEYDLDAWIHNLHHVYGRGKLSLKVGNLRFCISTLVKVGEEYLQVSINKLNINMDKLQFKITGLFDDDDLSAMVSAVVDELVPDLLDEYQDEMMGYSLTAVQDAVNAELKKVPLDTFMEMIMG